MSFKFEAPVTMPRLTTEEFKAMRAAYVAKHGYRIHIPGFEDVIKWDVTPEPTQQELELYLKKDVTALGAKRYFEIRDLMAEKKEKFLRILASPRPDILIDAASILTTLDDINDALGTLAVVGRIIARKLPPMAAKAIRGPLGWALLGADLVGLAMDLSSLPFKARRLQHELNDAVKGHPLSKKAKLRRLNKLKRLRITKGEAIEALQTTENTMGVGICLGPIMGLLWDIPSGEARELAGKKVTITGIPPIVKELDFSWAGLVKTFHQAWLSESGIMDIDKTKGFIAMNLATQGAKSYLQGVSPIDAIQNFDYVELLAPKPKYPSTRHIVGEELGDPDSHIGWVASGLLTMKPEDTLENMLEEVQEELGNWRDRNKQDTAAMVAAQNLVETGPGLLELLEPDEPIDMEYEPVAASMLELMNLNLRFPEDVTDEQGKCFMNRVTEHYQVYRYTDIEVSRAIAKDRCGFEFTTEVPERDVPPEYQRKEQAKKGIESLRKWYMKQLARDINLGTFYLITDNREQFDDTMDDFWFRLEWLERYDWPSGEPAAWWDQLSRIDRRLFSYFPQLNYVFLLCDLPEVEPIPPPPLPGWIVPEWGKGLLTPT